MILECNHSGNQKFLTSYCSDNTFNNDFVNLNLIEAEFLMTLYSFWNCSYNFCHICEIWTQVVLPVLESSLTI